MKQPSKVNSALTTAKAKILPNFKRTADLDSGLQLSPGVGTHDNLSCHGLSNYSITEDCHVREDTQISVLPYALKKTQIDCRGKPSL